MLTREDILDMPAGRKLDWEVAQIMGIGLEVFASAYEAGNYNYSTDISAAWEVVEKLKIEIIPQEGAPISHTYLTRILQEPFKRDVEIFAATAPEAISKAALIALMEGQAHETN